MSGSDGNVEIRITGAVDGSLSNATAQASADLNTLAARAQQFGGQSTIGANAFAAALKSVDGDLTKLTSEMLGVGAAATQGMEGAVSAEHAVEAATGGLRFATSGAVQEYIRLGHEALTGNLSRMPGSLIVLTSRMGGLTGATLTTIGAMGALGLAIAGPIAAMAYLAYRQHEAEKNAEALAEAAALSGQGATKNAAAIQGEITAMERLPGISSAVVQGLVAWDAAHGEVDDRIKTFVNQLAPQFEQASGDMPKPAVKAMGDLKTTLNEIVTGDVNQAIAAFDKLDKTSLHLSTSTDASKRALADQILKLIESGQRIDAVTAALNVLATQGGGHIKNFGQNIADLKAQIAEAHRNIELFKQEAASPQSPEAINVIATAIANAVAEAADLEARLRDLEGQAAKPKVNVAISSEDVTEKIRAIQQDLNLTDTQQLQKIVGYLNSVQNAEVQSAEVRKQVATALAQYKTELARKTGQDEIDAAREAAENSGKSGEALTRAEISADQAKLSSSRVTAQQKLEIRKDLASKNAELAREEAADAKKYDHEVAQEQKIGAEDAINTARNAAQEVLSNDRLNATERGALAKSIWDLLLSGDKLNASQRAAAAKDLADRIAHEEGLSGEQRVELEQQIGGILVNSAQLTAQQRAQAVRDGVDAETRAREIGRRTAEEIDKANTQAAVQAAKDEFEATSNLLDREADYYQITQTQKIRALQAATATEYDAEISAQQKIIDALRASGQTETLLYTQTSNKIIELERQKALKLEQLETQAAQQAVQTWRSILTPIESGFNSMFSNLLQGTQSFSQSTRQVLVQVVSEYLAARLKIEFDWLAGAAARALGDQTWAQKSVVEQLAIWLGLETQKTATADAGAAARTAASAEETATAVTASKTQAVGEIPAYTGIAAMEAASAVAGIPIVGPALAVAAAAEMNALGASELSLASAAGGDDFVAGGFYRLHYGEKVMPAPIAGPEREFFANRGIQNFIASGARGFDGSLSGGAALSGVGSGPHLHLDGMEFHVHTSDVGSMKAWLNSPDGKRTMQTYMRDSARSALKSLK